MFWGVIGLGYKGPCHIFEKRTQKQILAENEVIKAVQAIRDTQSAEQHQTAIKCAEDQGLPPSKKQQLKAKRRATYRGGIDWYVYVNEIIDKKVAVAWSDFNDLWHRDPDIMFMQDGAPAHRSEETQRQLAEQGICVLNWPGNSPDLNPIEHIWDLLKRRISDKYGIVTKRADMTRNWLREWELLEQDEIDSYIKGNIKNLHRVATLNGGNFYQG